MLKSLLEEHLKSQELRGMGFRQFCTQILKIRLTRQQYKIAKLVEDGHRNIAIGTGHSIGKTWVGACIFCWKMACSIVDPVVITTAPTNRQVSQIWRYIRTLWNTSARLREIAECKFQSLEISPMHYGMGFSTDEAGRFQGIHSPNLLFIIDEANHFDNDIWIAIDACCTGDQSTIFCIGNCVKPSGVFFKAFTSKDWKTMKVSSRKHPNVRANKELIKGAATRKWIEKIEADYPNPAIIGSRIDAIFPESSSNTLITRNNFRKAIDKEYKTTWPTVLAVNPYKYQDSNTTLVLIHGQKVDKIVELTDHNHLTICQSILYFNQNYKLDYIVMDDDAIGNALTNILSAQNLPLFSFHSSGSCNDLRYANQISEAYNITKAVINEGLLSIPKELEQLKQLEIQLTNREYEIIDSAEGYKIKIEHSMTYIDRMNMPSPDIADALVMASYIVATDWSNHA